MAALLPQFLNGEIFYNDFYVFRAHENGIVYNGSTKLSQKPYTLFHWYPNFIFLIVYI